MVRTSHRDNLRTSSAVTWYSPFHGNRVFVKPGPGCANAGARLQTGLMLPIFPCTACGRNRAVPSIAGWIRTQSNDKSRRWEKLGNLGLSANLQSNLEQVMPGTQSFLQRHEWIKHGTCYSKSPETYFADSIALMKLVNASGVQDLFARSTGQTLDGDTIRAAFDRAFGKGVGKRVRISCSRDGNRMVITELTLGLSGKITDKPDIAALALASPPTRPGCPAGVVDAVGLQ